MKNLIAVLIFMVGALTTSFAQTGQRIIGAQQFQLDDNNPAHPKTYLTSVSGALGIDNTGIVTPGTFPNPCALLDLASTTQGFLPPRMTTAQELAMCGGTPPEGMIVYNTTTHSLDVYGGGIWGAAGWALNGNALSGGTPTTPTQFFGSNNNFDVVLRSNGSERMRILAGGNVAVGATTATAHLQVTENGTAQHAITGTHAAATGTVAGVMGETNSQDANASAVLGVVNSSSPGGFSSAIRGINNGTGGLGIGVTGSQSGSGWGVYGNTPSGIGVYGQSTSGFGIYGQSTSGVSVYGVQPSNGTNSAGYFQNTNTANASPALFGGTNGTGPAISGAQGGTADAGLFSISNAANTAHALNASSNGSGDVVYSTAIGTGKAGLFQIVNAANNNDVLDAITNGVGRAGYFQNTNIVNTANVIEALNSGSGRALLGRRGAGSGITLGQTEAIRGDNSDGPGVAGTANTAVGVYGTSGTTHGVWGVAVTAGSGGIEGRNDVVGGYGVEGVSLGGGSGVHGQSQTGIAGKFDITNAANTSNAVQINTNGSGVALNVTSTNGTPLALKTTGGVQLTGLGEAAGKIFTSDGSGNGTWQTPPSTISIPEVVNFLGAYAGATSYSINDLVTSSTANMYWISLTNGNTGNTPETSPANWTAVTIEQLKIIHKTLTLSSPGFTSLLSTTLTGTNTASGRIQYMIRATDGGTQIATEEGVMQYLATANSITCTVQADDKLHLGTVNSGCTPGFFNPGSQPGVSIFDNVSFSAPAPIVDHDVYFRIVPAGGQYSSGAVTKTIFRLEP